MSSPSARDALAPPSVLVVDDEESVRHVLKTYLEMKGCTFLRTAASAEEALEVLSEFTAFDVALVDIVLPGKSGLTLLDAIRRQDSGTEVILMTSYGSVDTAIRAIRGGAYDYLEKPFRSLDHVWLTVQRAREKKRVKAGIEVPPTSVESDDVPEGEMVSAATPRRTTDS